MVGAERLELPTPPIGSGRSSAELRPYDMVDQIGFLSLPPLGEGLGRGVPPRSIPSQFLAHGTGGRYICRVSYLPVTPHKVATLA